MNETAKRHFSNGERGATVVEFAFVAVLLLVLIFGILEFSLLFLQEHFVANAAREGVRIGVRADNYNCFTAGDPDCTATTPIYRRETIIAQLTDCTAGGYLCTMYTNAITAGDVTIDIPAPTEIGTTRKSLTVTITTPNFMPPLVLAAVVPNYIHPDVITFSASGDYEDVTEP